VKGSSRSLTYCNTPELPGETEAKKALKPQRRIIAFRAEISNIRQDYEYWSPEHYAIGQVVRKLAQNFKVGHCENGDTQPCCKHQINEHRGRVFNITASYSGGSGFKSQPRYRISWLRVFVFYLNPSMQMQGQYLKIRTRPILSASFKIHNLPIILSFDVT
jgi:hypothetical protein